MLGLLFFVKISCSLIERSDIYDKTRIFKINW